MNRIGGVVVLKCKLCLVEETELEGLRIHFMAAHLKQYQQLKALLDEGDNELWRLELVAAEGLLGVWCGADRF